MRDGGAGARPHVHVLAVQASVLCVRGDGQAEVHHQGGHLGRLQVLGVQADVCGVLGGGAAGEVGNVVRIAALSHGALGCVERAGDRAGGHLGRLQ